MPKTTLTKGKLWREGKGSDVNIGVSFLCPACGKKLSVYLHSTGFGITRIRQSPSLIEAECICTLCDGWISVMLVNGFPTQKEIDASAEIDIDVTSKNNG